MGVESGFNNERSFFEEATARTKERLEMNKKIIEKLDKMSSAVEQLEFLIPELRELAEAWGEEQSVTTGERGNVAAESGENGWEELGKSPSFAKSVQNSDKLLRNTIRNGEKTIIEGGGGIDDLMMQIDSVPTLNTNSNTPELKKQNGDEIEGRQKPIGELTDEDLLRDDANMV